MFITVYVKKFFSTLKESARELKSVYALSLSGIILAIRTMLGSLAVLIIPTVKIGFSFLAIAAGAMLYGPFVGGIIGGIGDILSYIINPVGGSYFPGFSINGVLVGMIYGMFFYKKKVTLKRAICCELIIVVFVELLLSSLWLHIMFGKAFFAVLVSRLLKCAVMLPVNVACITCLGKLLPVLKKEYNKLTHK